MLNGSNSRLLFANSSESNEIELLMRELSSLPNKVLQESGSPEIKTKTFHNRRVHFIKKSQYLVKLIIKWYYHILIEVILCKVLEREKTYGKYHNN